QPELILLDVQMPGLDGHAVLQALRANPATSAIPVIFLTARNDPKDEAKGLAEGAVDYITKPISAAIVLARLATHLALANRQRALETRVAERTRALKDSRTQLMQRLALAMSYREGGLTHRSVRMAQYTKLIAEAAGARPEACELLEVAAPLHDIGTLGVPESILRSTEKLSEREWEQMRKHPEIGAEIIGEHRDPLLAIARAIALCHHERWDGSGYPRGLKGAAIPWAARVASVADAFEAMTATLRHREPMPLVAAARIIAAESGKQFDPAIVQAFGKALPKLVAVHKSVVDELSGFHDLNFSPEKGPK
ncbi:MAG: HD domain-containing protein, partial [Proteobacteria bacterium]|nr:HD domain-containing protein [Pseudomonadota bacterium]